MHDSLKISAVLFALLFCIMSADAKDKDIAAIETAYQSLDDFSAKFTQTTDIALVGRKVERKGVFHFKKGGKFRIEYEGDGGKIYVSDGTTLWIFVPEDEASLQVFTVNDESVPKEAITFLAGFGKIRKEFRVTESKAFPNATAGTAALHLVPRKGTKHYEYMDALFAPNHLISELVVKNISGNTSVYKFTDVRTNARIDDEVFALPAGN